MMYPAYEHKNRQSHPLHYGNVTLKLYPDSLSFDALSVIVTLKSHIWHGHILAMCMGMTKEYSV